jgi:hypothetical protein
MKLKMAVLAPMPRARVASATTVTIGVARSERIARRRSCMRPPAETHLIMEPPDGRGLDRRDHVRHIPIDR